MITQIAQIAQTKKAATYRYCFLFFLLLNAVSRFWYELLSYILAAWSTLHMSMLLVLDEISFSLMRSKIMSAISGSDLSRISLMMLFATCTSS